MKRELKEVLASCVQLLELKKLHAAELVRCPGLAMHRVPHIVFDPSYATAYSLAGEKMASGVLYYATEHFIILLEEEEYEKLLRAQPCSCLSIEYRAIGRLSMQGMRSRLEWKLQGRMDEDILKVLCSRSLVRYENM